MSLSPGAMRLRDAYKQRPDSAGKMIVEALLAHDWEVRLAAADLGVSRQTLYRFMNASQCSRYVTAAREKFLRVA